MHVFRFLVLATVTAGVVLLGPARADAHAMFVKVDATGDPVRLEAYFEEDMPAEAADVTVTDADGAVVLAGKTDERGVWTFPRPTRPGTYAVKVKQTGHVARCEFTVGGAAEGEPEQTVSTEPRLNKWVGLSIGVAVLLGVSGASWLIRRRGRRLE